MIRKVVLILLLTAISVGMFSYIVHFWGHGMYRQAIIFSGVFLFVVVMAIVRFLQERKRHRATGQPMRSEITIFMESVLGK